MINYLKIYHCLIYIYIYFKKKLKLIFNKVKTNSYCELKEKKSLQHIDFLHIVFDESNFFVKKVQRILMRQELKDDFDGLKIGDYGLPQQGEEEEEAVKSNVSRKNSITKSISKLKSFKGIKVM